MERKVHLGSETKRALLAKCPRIQARITSLRIKFCSCAVVSLTNDSNCAD